jgi:hypothetical protein
MKNNALISEWFSNSSTVNKALRSMKSKQGKEARMLRNIFKTQDIIDKYRVIYDSIKKPHKLIAGTKTSKLTKSRSVRRNRPNRSQLD